MCFLGQDLPMLGSLTALREVVLGRGWAKYGALGRVNETVAQLGAW